VFVKVDREIILDSLNDAKRPADIGGGIFNYQVSREPSVF